MEKILEMNGSGTINYIVDYPDTVGYAGRPDDPGKDPDAIIILIHGLGEHLVRYREWVNKFLAVNIGVVRFDLPGHGKSGGKRGHIANYGKIRSIVNLIRDRIKADHPEIPILLYGHSLGGNIVLDMLLSDIEGFYAAVVTSPWIRLAFEPGKLKLLLANVAGIIAPKITQSTGLISEHLSSDPAVAVAYRKDPLVHSVISVALYSSAARAAKRILRDANRINIPLLLVHGTEDKIASPVGSEEFVANCPGATIKLWEGGFHELHNEPFREEVFNFIYSWIRGHLPG